jgi:sortase B
MDKKRILLLGAMGILLAAAIALGAVWIMEAAEYAGYKADYVDIAEDVLHSDEDDGMIELVPLSPAPKQNDTLDDPTAPAATDPRSTAEPSRPASASNADGKEAAQRVSVDFAALAAQNSDTVGWLYIPGTKINYPVVQADDNEYYLSRSFKQEEASCGTIFMDYQNDLNPLDRNTILFGHNMGSSSSLMFSQLTKFKKQSYWEKHQTFQFDTPDRTGTWQVLAVCHLDVSTLEQFNFLQQDFLSDDSFLDFVQSLKARALYETHVSAPSDGRLLTLVTCDRSDGFGKSGRLLVVAVQIN